MSDLVAFLTARLGEDEATAKAGMRHVTTKQWWRRDPEPWAYGTGIVDDIGGVGCFAGSYAADHAVRHDPARVLREVAAKRKILAEVVPLIDGMDAQIGSEWGGGGYRPTGESDELLKIMAAVWSGHPDYDPSWA